MRSLKHWIITGSPSNMNRKAFIVAAGVMTYIMVVIFFMMPTEYRPNIERLTNGSFFPEKMLFLKQEIFEDPAPLHYTPSPIPPQDELENMTLKDLQAFYQSYIVSPQISCHKVLRMGLLTDGGWEICADPEYLPDKTSCLVYSYGIRYDFSFDDDMDTFGCEVHSFDPSMEQRDYTHGPNVFFHAIGVSGTNKTIEVKDHRQKANVWQLSTVANHRNMLNHHSQQRRLDIVKMDVEGYEYEALMAALEDGSLEDVRQLNFETHLSLGSGFPSREQYLKFLELLRKIYDKGFLIYTTHRNYVYSSFRSPIDGKYYAKCHEVHTVKVKTQ